MLAMTMFFCFVVFFLFYFRCICCGRYDSEESGLGLSSDEQRYDLRNIDGQYALEYSIVKSNETIRRFFFGRIRWA
jgi:hypothetical protein